MDGGWRITGQVPFGSGCHNAQWLAMPAAEMEGGRPKVDPATGRPEVFGVFFPRTEAEILDTWHTLGMRGTGSTDFAVRDLFVPDRMTAPVGPLSQPAPGFEGPLFRMWPWTAILGEATVSVGIAAAAVDRAVQLCRTKTAAYNATPLREQQLAQFQMGKAKARVEASRDTLHRAASAAYDEVARSGTGLSPDAKIRLQLAVCFAAEACAEAVRFVNDAVGASSIRLEQPFERHFRDVHVLLAALLQVQRPLRVGRTVDVRARERLGVAELLTPLRSAQAGASVASRARQGEVQPGAPGLAGEALEPRPWPRRPLRPRPQAASARPRAT